MKDLKFMNALFICGFVPLCCHLCVSSLLFQKVATLLVTADQHWLGGGGVGRGEIWETLFFLAVVRRSSRKFQNFAECVTSFATDWRLLLGPFDRGLWKCRFTLPFIKSTRIGSNSSFWLLAFSGPTIPPIISSVLNSIPIKRRAYFFGSFEGPNSSKRLTPLKTWEEFCSEWNSKVKGVFFANCGVFILFDYCKHKAQITDIVVKHVSWCPQLQNIHVLQQFP